MALPMPGGAISSAMKARIHLKLYATLQRQLPADAADGFEIDPGTTVEQLLGLLEIPVSEAKLVFVNGKIASPKTSLTGGERVGIFPPVGGG